MTRIIGGILLLRKLQSALHETYGAFYQLMSKTQFMAFALIAIGLCSRLSLLSKAWAKEHVDCYRLLETWMKFFPKDEARVEDVNYESQLPESIDSVLASSLPDILDDQLPPAPAYQPDDQSPEQTSSAKAVGSDLGEVIQRTQLLPSALATESILSSRPSPKPSPVRKHKLSSRSPSLEPENRQDQQPVDPATVSSDSHSNLLGELDMIFGSKPSTSNSSPSSTQKKKDMALPDLDDIFKRKKQKSKDKKPSVAGSGISNSSSPMSSAPSTPGSGFSTKSKSSTGSKSNFDSIFDFGLGSSSGSKTTPGLIPSSPSPGKKADGSNKVRKDKKDIDDIFGSIKKPKKKAPTSEIDSIFGPPKKKKKAP
ncbi:hypothetical protein EC991_010496 [Linnemannia zychae]|nr:hypothetical protein EC991_010496 [Linnemannia zychae]